MFDMDGEIELLNGGLDGELIIEENYPVLSGEVLLPASDWGTTPFYDGTYEITPLIETDQILETAGKRMADDVVVLAVPYYETTNESGGYTVIIG